MRGKRLLTAGVTVLVSIAGGALLWHRQRPKPAPASAQPPRVIQPPSGEVKLSGKIRAQKVVSVAATVDGTIEAFHADVGQEVEEGQLLARISSQGLETGREVATIALNNAQARATKIEAQMIAARLEASRAQADAIRARSEFERAEKTFTRQKFLHGQGATPRQAYEKSAREFETAQGDSTGLEKAAKQAEERVQALLEELRAARRVTDDKQKQLDDATGALAAADVQSPVNGVVVGRKGETGKSTADQGRDLFEIATDLTALRVAVEPEPPVLDRIRPGQPAVVLISDFQAEGIPAVVAEIQDTVVMVDFNSPDPAIKPGLVAEVRIKLE